MPEHSLATIYQDASAPEHLALFGPAAVREIEGALTDRAGKPYLPCLATGKEKQAKPEEVMRQLWLKHLADPRPRLLPHRALRRLAPHPRRVDLDHPRAQGVW